MSADRGLFERGRPLNAGLGGPVGSVCPADPASTKDCFDRPRLRVIGGITAGQVRRTDGRSAQPEKSSPHPRPRLVHSGDNAGERLHHEHRGERPDEQDGGDAGQHDQQNEGRNLADGSHSMVRITARFQSGRSLANITSSSLLITIRSAIIATRWYPREAMFWRSSGVNHRYRCSMDLHPNP